MSKMGCEQPQASQQAHSIDMLLSKKYSELVELLSSNQKAPLPAFNSVPQQDEYRSFVDMYATIYTVNNVPLIISKALVDEFDEVTASLSRIFQKVYMVYAQQDGNAFAEHIGESPLFFEIMKEYKVDARDILMRHDIIISKGQIKLIEINAGSQIGGWQVDFFEPAMRAIMAQDATMSKWNVKYKPALQALFASVINSVRRLKPRARGNVVIVLDLESKYAEMKSILEALFAKVTHHIFDHGQLFSIGAIEDLNYHDDKVFYQGVEIDAVLLSTEEEIPQQPLMHLVRANMEGQCYVPDAPIFTWINNKNLMPVMHESRVQQWLTADEIAFINKFVPWGQILGRFNGSHDAREALKKRLIEQQQHLVLKKAKSLQGIDVVVGKFTPTDTWLRYVEQHIDNPEWLAQEYCEPDQMTGFLADVGKTSCSQVWGIFDFENSYKGGFVRAAWQGSCADGVINSAKGATEFMLFEEQKKNKKIVL
ncbi:hypothetical protein [Flocculibacter collagenilyticus]|uniref:hypothetical protein n=1 Tax=Flocculibacter collagenilyticus TaxID=2744479 RepID=UPI0018F538E3|nr:hypothetical protein [Flocculibacter collagenilyticus]